MPVKVEKKTNFLFYDFILLVLRWLTEDPYNELLEVVNAHVINSCMYGRFFYMLGSSNLQKE